MPTERVTRHSLLQCRGDDIEDYMYISPLEKEQEKIERAERHRLYLRERMRREYFRLKYRRMEDHRLAHALEYWL